jgi:hypothetical protein
MLRDALRGTVHLRSVNPHYFEAFKYTSCFACRDIETAQGSSREQLLEWEVAADHVKRDRLLGDRAWISRECGRHINAIDELRQTIVDHAAVKRPDTERIRKAKSKRRVNCEKRGDIGRLRSVHDRRRQARMPGDCAKPSSLKLRNAWINRLHTVAKCVDQCAFNDYAISETVLLHIAIKARE